MYICVCVCVCNDDDNVDDDSTGYTMGKQYGDDDDDDEFVDGERRVI